MERPPRTIYFEFIVAGKFVKVTAIDSETQCEACVVAPVGSPRSALESAAQRKLAYVLKRAGRES